MITDTITFSTFNESIGVGKSDTFRTWRQKLNGVINEVSTLRDTPDYVLQASESTQNIDSSLFVEESNFFSSNTIYVGNEGGMYFTGLITSPAYSPSSDTPKLIAANIFDGESVESGVQLASDSGDLKPFASSTISVERLIHSGSDISLRGLSYTLPSSAGAQSLLFLGDNNEMSWSSLQSIVDLISAGANTFQTTDILQPVGTVLLWLGEFGSLPSGWVHDSQTIQGGVALYPVLATILGQSGTDLVVPDISDELALPPESNFHYIIKAEENDVVQFNITPQNGVQLFDEDGNVTSSISLASSSGSVGLAITDSLKFTGGKLDINEVETSQIVDGAVTPTKLSSGAPMWDENGFLSSPSNSSATLPEHVVTKGYVDTNTTANEGLSIDRFVDKSRGSGDVSLSGWRSLARFNKRNELIVSSVDVVDHTYGAHASGVSNGKIVNKQIRFPFDITNPKVYTDFNHTFVVDADSGVCYGMGRNHEGDLASTSAATTFIKSWTRSFPYGAVDEIVMVGNGHDRSIAALMKNGDLYGAGHNGHRQLTSQNVDNTRSLSGNGVRIAQNVKLAAKVGYDTGNSAFAWVNTSNTLFARGESYTGEQQLNYHASVNASDSKVITDLYGLTGISSNRGGTFYARNEDGDLYAWGQNRNGQIPGRQGTPFVDEVSMTWRSSDRGGPVDKVYPCHHAPGVFVLSNERLFVTGRNANGQFGIGSNTSNNNISNWTQVSFASIAGEGLPTRNFSKVVDFFATPNINEGTNEFFAIVENVDGDQILVTFGNNYDGASGTGITDSLISGPRHVPFNRVSEIKDIVHVENSESCSVIILNDGSSYYAGSDKMFRESYDDKSYYFSPLL